MTNSPPKKAKTPPTNKENSARPKIKKSWLKRSVDAINIKTYGINKRNKFLDIK